MCGIAGIYFKNSEKKRLDNLKRMLDAMEHRGPDNWDIEESKNLLLGHRRLSIIDLQDSANQPIQDPDRHFILSFNGEIYNYQQIKNEIKNYEFKTNSDTEVVLAAYKNWGKDCLNKMNGMFAFAIWDSQKEELFLARDRMGIKPLYLFEDENYFLFSSEIRALLHSGIVDRKINMNSLSHYLSYSSVQEPETILHNIHQLKSGNYALFSKNQLSTKPYWSFDKKKIRGNLNHDSIKKNIRKLLYDSVEKRMISDVKLGAFLSGGIDSSIIVGIMSEISSGPVNTVNVSFSEDSFDESAYADLVSKKFKTNHHKIVLDPKELVKELPEILDKMDYPTSDGINSYVVSKFANESGITTMLSGLGGDELFCGYPVFGQLSKIQKQWLYWQLPSSIRKLLASPLSFFAPEGKKFRVFDILTSKDKTVLNLYPIFRQLSTPKENQKMIQSLIPNSFPNPLDNLTIDKEYPELSKISIAELSTYTKNILLRDSDQFGMANSIEIRVPFLDHKLVEFILQIPDKYKYPYSTKKLLIESLGHILPKEIYLRKKMGFVFPWEFWIRNELKSFCEDKITYLSKRKFFNAENLREYWRRFLNGDPSIKPNQIWQLVVFEHWFNKNDITG